MICSVVNKDGSGSAVLVRVHGCRLEVRHDAAPQSSVTSVIENCGLIRIIIPGIISIIVSINRHTCIFPFAA